MIASIEDVGRQLSQLTRANGKFKFIFYYSVLLIIDYRITAMPRIGGSLQTTIADTEKQIQHPTGTLIHLIIFVSYSYL